MSQIEELQGRIAAALDRIGQGLDRVSDAGGGADPAEIETLRQELEDERLANEQLKERIKVLKTRREGLEAELEAARQESAETIGKVDSSLQGLREANDKLRDINVKLREANEAGVGEPHLINKAMMAELEALRAARSADRAEAEAVYSELSAAVETAGTAETPAQDQSEEA